MILKGRESVYLPKTGILENDVSRARRGPGRLRFVPTQKHPRLGQSRIMFLTGRAFADMSVYKQGAEAASVKFHASTVMNGYVGTSILARLRIIILRRTRKGGSDKIVSALEPPLCYLKVSWGPLSKKPASRRLLRLLLTGAQCSPRTPRQSSSSNHQRRSFAG